VSIRSITGTVVDLPLAAEKNTAGMAALALQRELGLPFGFELDVVKGIPLGSGLGGSAASAVAAVVAAAAVVDQPLDRTQLLKFAMQGEAVASGSVHVDNIAPSLFGGLVLTVGVDNPHVKQIPVPEAVRCVLVHPHMVLATREARAILSKTITLSDSIWQQANLAGFLAGCFTSDLPLIRESLLDVVIEPQRQVLIPGFAAVKRAALDARVLARHGAVVDTAGVQPRGARATGATRTDPALRRPNPVTQTRPLRRHEHESTQDHYRSTGRGQPGNRSVRGTGRQRRLVGRQAPQRDRAGPAG